MSIELSAIGPGEYDHVRAELDRIQAKLKTGDVTKAYVDQIESFKSSEGQVLTRISGTENLPQDILEKVAEIRRLKFLVRSEVPAGARVIMAPKNQYQATEYSEDELRAAVDLLPGKQFADIPDLKGMGGNEHTMCGSAAIAALGLMLSGDVKNSRLIETAMKQGLVLSGQVHATHEGVTSEDIEGLASTLRLKKESVDFKMVSKDAYREFLSGLAIGFGATLNVNGRIFSVIRDRDGFALFDSHGHSALTPEKGEDKPAYIAMASDLETMVDVLWARESKDTLVEIFVYGNEAPPEYDSTPEQIKKMIDEGKGVEEIATSIQGFVPDIKAAIELIKSPAGDKLSAIQPHLNAMLQDGFKNIQLYSKQMPAIQTQVIVELAVAIWGKPDVVAAAKAHAEGFNGLEFLARYGFDVAP